MNNRPPPPFQQPTGPPWRGPSAGDANAQAVRATQVAPSGAEADAQAATRDAERTASDHEDASWVVAAREGDHDAFDRLYTKYRERVFAVILRVVHHRDDALETAQDVFLKVYRSLDRFESGTRFYTWLYRIAVNQSIDLLRRRGVRKERSYPVEIAGSEEAHGVAAASKLRGPSARVEAHEVRERLAAAMRELPDKHRQVFVLYSQEDMSYGEIAEVLQIPIGTVMSRLFYARRKMRESLPQDWDPGGAAGDPNKRKESAQ
jgi:RNA polymerase sigma-70 factor (ECF subfamily)